MDDEPPAQIDASTADEAELIPSSWEADKLDVLDAKADAIEGEVHELSHGQVLQERLLHLF